MTTRTLYRQDRMPVFQNRMYDSHAAGHPVDRVIDINPAKQGRYLAATGLRVMSPAEGLADLPEGSEIHVMNPNYLEEVRAMAGPRFVCKGPHHDRV